MMTTRTLSRWIERRREALARRGHLSLVLGGSTALSILLADDPDAPIRARDVDLFVAAHGGRAHAEAVVEIARELEADGLGVRRSRALRDKVRAGHDGAPAHLGLGTHVHAASGPICSVSLLDDIDSLELNGLLDVDTVTIRMDAQTSLLDALARGRVHDRHGALESARRRDVRVAHWAEVERRGLHNALRLVRGIAKYDALSAATRTLDELRERAPWRRDAVLDHELARALDKTLSSHSWRAQLRALARLGALADALPGLHEYASRPLEFDAGERRRGAWHALSSPAVRADPLSLALVERAIAARPTTRGLGA